VLIILYQSERKRKPEYTREMQVLGETKCVPTVYFEVALQIQPELILSCCGHRAFLLFKMVRRFGCLKEVEKIAVKDFVVSSFM
jgi:hypothetical protein